MIMKSLSLFILFFLSLTGCRNLFQETAKTDTDEAIYYEAKMLLNDRDYTGALARFQILSPAYLAQRPVQLFYASAYSGRCGLEFVDFITDLGNVGSATSMFTFLMTEYPTGSDSKISDCKSSEDILNNFGTYLQRTSDENILMLVSSLTKVGVVLSRYADTDGNGTVDASFDHCDKTAFPDNAIREVGTGIANSILSITGVGTSISSSTLQDITAMCALDPHLNVFCSNVDASAYSQLEVDFLRAILGSTTEGIGACPGGFAACVCP